MATLMALFFLLFLMVSLPVITYAQQYPYLKLVLQNGQHYQRPRHFTIQGLWPHGIAFCNINPPFQPSTQLPANMLQQLALCWPDIKNGPTGNYRLWDAEYTKHGSCAIQHFSPIDYFARAEGLWMGLDLDVELLLAGLIPNVYCESITFQSVTTRIHERYHIHLKCRGTHLQEVTFCFSSDGRTRRNCPSKSNCRGDIMYF